MKIKELISLLSECENLEKEVNIIDVNDYKYGIFCVDLISGNIILDEGE